MKQRCFNPNNNRYKIYGARGITVCDAWVNDFWAFYDHIGPRPGPEFSLDRIDNDRGYEPHNVRWTTTAEQLRNRRITLWITYRGVTLSTDQWAAILGCDVAVLAMRKGRKWDDARIIETPIRKVGVRNEEPRRENPHLGKGLLAAFGQPFKSDAQSRSGTARP